MTLFAVTHPQSPPRIYHALLSCLLLPSTREWVQKEISLWLVYLYSQQASENRKHTPSQHWPDKIIVICSSPFRFFFLFGSILSKSSLFGQSSVNHNLLWYHYLWKWRCQHLCQYWSCSFLTVMFLIWYNTLFNLAEALAWCCFTESPLTFMHVRGWEANALSMPCFLDLASALSFKRTAMHPK